MAMIAGALSVVADHGFGGYQHKQIGGAVVGFDAGADAGPAVPFVPIVSPLNANEGGPGFRIRTQAARYSTT